MSQDTRYTALFLEQAIWALRSAQDCYFAETRETEHHIAVARENAVTALERARDREQAEINRKAAR